MIEPAVMKKRKQRKNKVEFELFAPEAESVFLAGDFNQWNEKTSPLAKQQNGMWRIALNLAPGRYEYRYWVDGNWQNDPQPVECVPNAFGTWNCVKKVE